MEISSAYGAEGTADVLPNAQRAAPRPVRLRWPLRRLLRAAAARRRPWCRLWRTPSPSTAAAPSCPPLSVRTDLLNILGNLSGHKFRVPPACALPFCLLEDARLGHELCIEEPALSKDYNALFTIEPGSNNSESLESSTIMPLRISLHIVTKEALAPAPVQRRSTYDALC